MKTQINNGEKPPQIIYFGNSQLSLLCTDASHVLIIPSASILGLFLRFFCVLNVPTNE